MRKGLLFSYLIIVLILVVSMSLSRSATEKLRGGSASILAPFWEKIGFIKKSSSENTLNSQEQILSLQLEKQLLLNELEQAQELLLLQMNPPKESHIEALPARVISRSLDSWNTALWINVGDEDNPPDQHKVILPNSPVLVGDAVIGLIDLVGKHQSRVRLITDSAVTPAVRSARGGLYDRFLCRQLESLVEALKLRKPKQLHQEEQKALIQKLNQLHETLQPEKRSWYLAKGIVSGSANLSRRHAHPLLKGSSFNYDYTDTEGGARDLRTGQLQDVPGDEGIPILKVNDLLVTTGLDGVFPPNLQVGIVTHVHLLKEGDYFYELEARPIVSSLDELTFVLVIPPIYY